MKGKRSGQVTILFVFITGIFLATLVYFGISKLTYFRKEVTRLEGAQVAQSVLSSAALRVQQIYANESGCDPDVLDQRLNRLPPISGAGTAGSFAVAAPGAAALSPERINRCVDAEGCRQLRVTLEGKAFLVTAAGVGAMQSSVAADKECPRDATSRLAVTIAGTVYHRRVTLINVCTFQSCGVAGSPSFEGIDADVSGATSTSACGVEPIMKFGSVVLHPTTPTNQTNHVTVDDLRWARRYISTGAGAVGDTTYLNTTGTSGNGTCADGASSGQCVVRNCVPAFDLNLDRTNNEADLAILEYYMRGYIPRLPVREF